MRRTPALIVGGGPAGTAAAITLARRGVAPLLIERTASPQAIVCGGFTGWDAIAALERLGVDPWALGGHPITRLRIVTRHRTIETKLPGRAAGLSRARLDAALLDAATQAGADIRRGVSAREINGPIVRLSGGETIVAEALFLATGKHDVRGHARRTDGSRGHVGLRSTLPAPADLSGTIELHPFNGGYAGLLVQEDGRANLCLSLSAERFVQIGGSAIALAAALAIEAPILARHIAEADEEWAAIAGVPYGWRALAGTTGLFRVGDQAAVIASVVGDGIAMALAGGIAAAEAWADGGAGAAIKFQRRFGRRVGRAIRVAEAARALAERPRLASTVLPIVSGAPGLLGIAARLTRCH